MRSVLDTSKLQNGDNKALNFTLAFYGETEKVKEAVTRLQSVFRERINELSVSLYDLFALDRAQVYPELLLRRNRLTFRKADYCDKQYIGYFHCDGEEKLQKLHAHLFSSPPVHFPFLVPPSPPYYTQNRLLQLLSTPSDSTDMDPDKEKILDDFGVDYHFENRDGGKSYAIIKHYINSVCFDEDLSEPLSWFDSVIEDLDAHCSDAFQSAYISYHNPDFAVLHQMIYKSGYDIHALDRFVLGLEWSVYFSNRILQSEGRRALQDLADTVSVRSLSNGCQYKAQEEIRRFRNSARNKISRSLKELLIPACGLYSWWEVYRCAQMMAMYLPQTVSVYSDKFDPREADIIFSYNLSFDEIGAYASLRAINQQDLLGRFRLKEPEN